MNRSPVSVWNVLSNGDQYADWVVGTRDSSALDDSWPAEGSALRYRVKLGRWTVEGNTVSRFCDPPRRLELEAQSGPLGTARIAIEVRPWGQDALVIVDEHPLSGPGARVHNVALDAVFQLRHRNMLKRLARVVERSAPPGPSGGS
ncbi:SRPBCC family protein [Streptomyces sp. 8N706]|uniref:SRPBCC family protein n=1 Tax=Streptomyces sp. 8N706 TaxID=3457416 RepID=UPI003FD205CA